MNTILGMGGDPGGSGAIAIVLKDTPNRIIIIDHDMMLSWYWSNENKKVTYDPSAISLWGTRAVGIEKVRSRPTDGKDRVMVFGRNTGAMTFFFHLTTGLSIVEEIPIDEWQAHHMLSKWHLRRYWVGKKGEPARKACHKIRLIQYMEKGEIQIQRVKRVKQNGAYRLILEDVTTKTLVNSSVDAALIAMYVVAKYRSERLIDIL